MPAPETSPLSSSSAAASPDGADDEIERKRADEVLPESEGRFRLMANAITQLAWIARPDGHILWYNQRWYEYTGTTPEQMEGWAWQSVHDSAELPAVLERWEASLATGQPFEMTFPLRGADGIYRQFLTRVIPLKNANGEVTQWFGTNTDVDGISRAEAALRESERFNVAVLDSLPAQIAVLDRDGRIIAVNKPWSEIANANVEASPECLGVGADYLAVCRRASATGDDVAQRTLDGLTGVIEGQSEDFQMEYACPTAGRRRWFALHVVRAPRNVGGAIVTHTDITERRRTEELMLEQNSLLELIATGSPLDDCLAAFCTAISRLNNARACIFLADAVAGSFARAIAPGLSDFATGIANAPNEQVGGGVCAAAALSGEAVACADIAADQRWSSEWRTLCLTHDIRACHSAPVLDGDGRALAVLTLYFREAREPSEWELCLSDFGTHLTRIVLERERGNAALREAKEAAEAANQAKDRFLAVLSHELRTPLTPVLLAVSDLTRDSHLPPEVREDLAMIKRNVELETKLIDDLLDLSRITSGKVELKTEPVDLNAAVREVCGICRPQIISQNVSLEMELSDEAGIIDADPARLHQVLWNVVRNAVKFTPAHGRIWVSTARISADQCEVRVRDTGIGIPPEILPRIFNAFDQGEAHITRQFGGLGLGLAISRVLVELHGGTILAESPGAGQGATFIIGLPGHPTKAAAPLPAVVSAGDHAAPSLRLLLVEDHADTAHTLGRLLRAAGFYVIAAADVAGAVAVVEREPFDLLVSDLGLPDGTGYDIMQAVRARRGVPGIAMSGFGMDEDIRRSREAGFAEHLVKPIEVTKLIAAIRRAADKRG
jgi:PAS domain S-box-containing protein